MSNKEFLSVPLNSINSSNSSYSSYSSSSSTKRWYNGKLTLFITLLLLTGLLGYCTYSAVDLYKKNDSLSGRIHIVEAGLKNITTPSA